jgi:hypothetical protein
MILWLAIEIGLLKSSVAPLVNFGIDFLRMHWPWYGCAGCRMADPFGSNGEGG